MSKLPSTCPSLRVKTKRNFASGCLTRAVLWDTGDRVRSLLHINAICAFRGHNTVRVVQHGWPCCVAGCCIFVSCRCHDTGRVTRHGHPCHASEIFASVRFFCIWIIFALVPDSQLDRNLKHLETTTKLHAPTVKIMKTWTPDLLIQIREYC